MNLKSEIIHAGILAGLFLAILLIAEIARYRFNQKTEITRKFIHFANGAVCLFFPYLITSHWTLVIIGVIFGLLTFITRKTGKLRSLHDIERRSEGGLYYPLAVYLTFVIAQNAHRPDFYQISILVLAVSDSLAALVGGRYGFKVYKVEEDHKSLEGSIIFFISTFLIVHLGLLFLSPIGRAESVLAAVYIAMLVTTYESISLSGADNLFIPLGTIAALLRVAHMPAGQLASHIVILIAIFLLIVYLARFSHVFGLSGIIGIALTVYGTWMLTDVFWIVPLLLSIALFNLTGFFIEPAPIGGTLYQIRSVFFVLLGSFVWILVATFTPLPSHLFFVPFVVNLTANLGIFWHRKTRIDRINGTHHNLQFLRNANILTRATLLTIGLLSINLVLDKRLNPPLALATCFCGTLVVEFLHWQLEKRFRDKWSEIKFIKVNSVLILSVSSLISIFNIAFYLHHERIESSGLEIISPQLANDR